MAAAVTDSNLPPPPPPLLPLPRSSAPLRIERRYKTLLEEKKSVLSDELSGYECHNSGGVQLSPKIWFWTSEEEAGTFTAFGIRLGEFGDFLFFIFLVEFVDN